MSAHIKSPRTLGLFIWPLTVAFWSICYIWSMFDKRYQKYIQSFFLVLPMTLIVTCINTLVAKGLDGLLTMATLQRWSISFLVAYPTVLFMIPLAAKITKRLIKAD